MPPVRPHPAPLSTTSAGGPPAGRVPGDDAPVTPPPARLGRPARSSRCWTLRGAEGLVDGEAPADAPPLVPAVLPLLRRALGVRAPGLWSGSARLDADLPLSSAALRHGALLALEPPSIPSATTRG